MAKFEKFAKKLWDLEGGYVNNPFDRGGSTNRGITLEVYQKFYPDKTLADLKELTFSEFVQIAKTLYWDRWKADEIQNQSIAEFLVDWVYNSGVWGIKIPQRILKVEQDGYVGQKTINAINESDGALLFCHLQQAREKFFRDIAHKSPSQLVFLKGWLNRNNSFHYTK
jgi:lysozyme family protein